MSDSAWLRAATVGSIWVVLGGATGITLAAETSDEGAARLRELQQQITEQTRRLDDLKRALAQQESIIEALRRTVSAEALAAQRGGSSGKVESQVAQTSQPVGQAPERDSRPAEVATIFEQPGVLTPRGKFVFEPSLQYSYSSANRVALVGYTIIPALHIGVIDVREVKRNTVTATLTGRYGLTNRFEIEARLPYVYRSDSTVGRELSGSATNTVFEADGRSIGDVEFTARYQLNDGGLDKPYFVGSLRFKTRTGKDPFEVDTLPTGEPGLRAAGLQKELPTGSGFYGLQPALTALYPSDPAVFFGTVSYLRNFERDNVSQLVNGAQLELGSVKAGDVIGFNFGMGLALNERSSFSLGYDHASVGRTKLNGATAPESVRVQLGTLLLGYSYRLNAKRTLNVSLGAGLTRDTPDVTLTVRLPTTF